MATSLNINGNSYKVDVNEDMPLLWVLRDELGLTGTKYSCGIGVCGACNVLIDGALTRSCVIRVGDVKKAVTTIEGSSQIKSGQVILEAWVEEQVAQCGYCQPGQIVNAISLLNDNASPSHEQIVQALSGTLCRCGTYGRIHSAVTLAAEKLAAKNQDNDTS